MNLLGGAGILAVRMTRLWLLHAFFLAGLAALSCATRGQDPPARPPRIVILHTNDFHGQVLPARDRAGLAALAAKIKKLRAEETAKGARVFVVDCGDFFQGTPEGDLSEGRIMVDAYNEIGYDVLCTGNHDYDFGPAVLAALARRARFPFLAANVRDADDRVPGFLKPKAVFEDARVEFIGLLTSEMPIVTVERARVGLSFPPEKDVLEKMLPGCRFRTVVLSHAGHDREMELARSHPLAAWIGGHTHKKIREQCGPTFYSQAGTRGEVVGVVEIGERTTGRFEPVSRAEGEDGNVREIVARYAPEIDRVMNEAIGEVAQDVSREANGSSLLGNWLCDVMRRATGAEIAFHNRAGIRADLAKGPVRLRDLYQVSPFGNTLVTMKLTGAQILELLAHAVRKPRFVLEVSGMEYRTDLAEVKVGGLPIDREREYLVVTNSFLAKGGDACVVFTRGREVKDTLLNLLEVHKEEVRRNSPVKLTLEPRIHVE